MRVVLLGAGGMLARDLHAASPRDVELRVFTHAELDVTDQQAVHHAIQVDRPDIILNAAGYTRVDAAESDWEAASAVNGAAPGMIGRVAAEVGAAVVHFSTDYVFDGKAARPYREDDQPNPLSAYGRSKHEGEVGLRDSGAAHLIIRTQWLFGLHGRSFPRTMWERAWRRERTRVVNDQTGRPTWTEDLARATWRLVESGARGVLNVANAGTATWYDLARRMFDAAGVPELVEPCMSAEYPTPARRPAWSVLDTSRYEMLAGEPLRPWPDALDAFLAALTATQPVHRGSR